MVFNKDGKIRFFRRSWLAGVGCLLLLGLLVADRAMPFEAVFWRSGWRTQSMAEDLLRQLHSGMSKQEVLDRLGQPDSWDPCAEDQSLMQLAALNASLAQAAAAAPRWCFMQYRLGASSRLFYVRLVDDRVDAVKVLNRHAQERWPGWG